MFRITLLGTGCPIPDGNRFGPCTLVEAGSLRILVDAGRGATIRLQQCGIPIGSVDALLLTHFHSDHVVGIPDVWLTGWLAGPFGRRNRPLRVIGPVGTNRMIRSLRKAFSGDIAIRVADERLPPAGAELVGSEFCKDGVVFNECGVAVTAFAVDHGPAIKPAFGFRFDYEGRTIVVSGDTRICENLIANAAGVDLLIHEVAMASPALHNEERVRRVMAHHSSPAEVAEVLSRSRPKLAVLTHIVLLGTEQHPAPREDDVLREVQRGYSGQIRIGADLTIIDLPE